MTQQGRWRAVLPAAPFFVCQKQIDRRDSYDKGTRIVRQYGIQRQENAGKTSAYDLQGIEKDRENNKTRRHINLRVLFFKHTRRVSDTTAGMRP